MKAKLPGNAAAWLQALAALPRLAESRISRLGPPPPRRPQQSHIHWG